MSNNSFMFFRQEAQSQNNESSAVSRLTGRGAPKYGPKLFTRAFAQRPERRARCLGQATRGNFDSCCVSCCQSRRSPADDLQQDESGQMALPAWRRYRWILRPPETLTMALKGHQGPIIFLLYFALLFSSGKIKLSIWNFAALFTKQNGEIQNGKNLELMIISVFEFYHEFFSIV